MVVDYEIRQIGELPGFIIVSLFVPDGLIHPLDPSVRVRWDVLFNDRPVPSQGRDVRLRDSNAKELRVLPILFTKPNKSDQEISIWSGSIVHSELQRRSSSISASMSSAWIRDPMS